MICLNCKNKMKKIFERDYFFVIEILYKCPNCGSLYKEKIKKFRNKSQIFSGNYKSGEILSRL